MAHHAWHESLVGDLVNDHQGAQHAGHDAHQRNVKDTRRAGGRHDAQRYRRADAGREEYWLARSAIDPHAREQGNYEGGHKASGIEVAHVQRRRVQGQDRGEGHGQLGDVRSEERDRFTCPQTDIVSVMPDR